MRNSSLRSRTSDAHEWRPAIHYHRSCRRTFILAGMDTTSNATSRLLHILACNPDVQTKLRNEILDAQAEQEVSYDQLMSLPYLDAVCRETLRLCVISCTALPTCRS